MKCTYGSSGLAMPAYLLLLLALAPAVVHAQDATPTTAKPPATETPAQDQQQPGQPGQPDKRVFGVFPNYRTTDNDRPFAPISTKQKFIIGLKDSFDWPVYITSGAFAALYQLENQNPSFGQGMKGYARRYGTALADQTIGNMMTESIMPSVFHQDPRYFRIGRGSVKHRALYAATRIFVTKTDAGTRSFNFAEVVGNSAAVAISNSYYPDTRDVSDNVERLGIALATDAFSQVMKEFWPDVKHWMFHRHETPPPMLAH
jgi:hypothetical protein